VILSGSFKHSARGRGGQRCRKTSEISADIFGLEFIQTGTLGDIFGLESNVHRHLAAFHHLYQLVRGRKGGEKRSKGGEPRE